MKTAWTAGQQSHRAVRTWLKAQVPSSVQFSRSVVSSSLQPHESQHTRPPCPSPIPGVYPNSWPAPSRARTLEAGQGLGRLAQHRAASRPGLCAIAPGRRAGVFRCGSSLSPSQYRLSSTRRQPASSLPRSGHWAPNLTDYFLFYVGEIFNYNLFKNVLTPFHFLFFFWEPYNSNIGAFNVVPEVSETILSSFHSFYFILLFRSYFY